MGSNRRWDTLAAFEAAVKPPEVSRSWEEMFVDLMGDPAERVVIDDLCTALRKTGSFKEPIIVEGDVLQDGRHRYCAYRIVGISPVSFDAGGGPVPQFGSADGLAGPSVEPSCYIQVTYKLSGNGDGGMPLRSFPVGEGWAVADVSATSNTGEGWAIETYTYNHYGEGVEVTEEIAESVAEAGRRRGIGLGLEVEVLSCEIGSPYEN